MSQTNCTQCGALCGGQEGVSRTLPSNELSGGVPSKGRVGELEQEILRLQDERETLNTNLKNVTEQKTAVELELAKAQLDLQNAKDMVDELRSALSQIRNSDATQLQLDMQSLAEKLIAETATRSEIEHAKFQIESELEDLSAKLFEEANTMVATEKKLRLEAERKHTILKRKLMEVQGLTNSQKEQLDDLKSRLVQTADEKDKESAERIRMEKERDELELALMDGSISGSPRSSYRLSKNGSNRLSLSSVPSDSAYDSSCSEYECGSSESELTFHLGDFRFDEFKEFLETPTNPKSLLSTKFMKRVAAEDIEPAMRFESFNVRSWFQQRKLANATQSGTLIIESVNIGSPVSSPVSSPSKPSIPAITTDSCNLCLQHINTPNMYRIRYDDSDSEPKDICAYCRERLFSVCEFYTFVRLVHSNIIKGTPQRLYLEAARLRLKMFLGRIGSNVDTDGMDEVRESNALATK
ncbi:hypothetical protein K493DRAFT_314751 [Basidiobolus meristosporus CBS 931.73]|uniref:GDP/GTP exchange factor Sec2 N-terminal domain-containing protein n=1 Tax=Basidiobolus meristosporus CBS 931.73 TaxID=1314790 RepID=A0A1Y1YD51_9FUNG|nr:hypothetical protein K493DRAFT_314751 [Basidiobolus meristosporus CBS 931.73]|eukprot:ORX95951.1 hypothetical protein K493DRAFT_314751 [Basidiobolus meristosporus CBS 931.73]